jgi:predicted RNase H-like nuclease
VTRTVGVDWGSNGWVCVCLDDGDGDDAGEASDGGDPTTAVAADGLRWSATLEPSILSVWRRYGEPTDGPVLVDIPIGLPTEGTRACDRAAKRALGSRGASVFLTPPRAALTAPTYGAAKAATEARTDGSLTTQTWNILPRVQEVDDLLQSAVAPGQGIREAHPEVCFHRLASDDGAHGDEPLPSKHDADGVVARRAVLDATVPGAAAVYDDLVAAHIDDQPTHARRFRAGNDDDILDAMCLAITARVAVTDADGDFQRFGGTDRDPVLNRPIEIVYATPAAPG